jgi:release factor glutamine methyltransferase
MKRKLWRLAMTLRLRLLLRRRYGRLVLEDLDGLPLVVLPRVFNPKLLRSGAFLVEQLGQPDVLHPSRRVLDLGTGSGAAAVAAARAGCNVVAVDINPDAVRCARINALLNDVECRVDARHGDLFGPIDGDRFDLILFNPPYYRGTPRDALDHAWRSPDLIERFAAGLRSHLTPEGRALMVLSSDGECDAYLAALSTRGFRTSTLARRDFRNEEMYVYQVAAC